MTTATRSVVVTMRKRGETSSVRSDSGPARKSGLVRSAPLEARKKFESAIRRPSNARSVASDFRADTRRATHAAAPGRSHRATEVGARVIDERRSGAMRVGRGTSEAEVTSSRTATTAAGVATRRRRTASTVTSDASVAKTTASRDRRNEKMRASLRKRKRKRVQPRHRLRLLPTAAVAVAVEVKVKAKLTLRNEERLRRARRRAWSQQCAECRRLLRLRVATINASRRLRRRSVVTRRPRAEVRPRATRRRRAARATPATTKRIAT